MNAEIALIVFLTYWLIIEALRTKGVLEKYDITAYGPLLMIRSKRIVGFLKKLSKYERFWRIYAIVGVPLIFIGMAFMFFLIIFMDYVLLTSPPPPSEITSPRNVLLIPGVNQFIPLIWGAIGLLVTLIVHEFSHGILALVEKIRVKSVGVLLLLLPIGGFAEPDEEELKKAETSKKIRVFASGITGNFIVAALAFVLFFHFLSYISPAVAVLHDSSGRIEAGTKIVEVNGVKIKTPEDFEKAITKTPVKIKLENGKEIVLNGVVGVEIIGVMKDMPAEGVLKEGMIIVEVDGKRIVSTKQLAEILKNKKPGEEITLKVWNGSGYEVKSLVLGGEDRALMGVYIRDNVSGIVPSYPYAERILSTLKSIPKMITNPAGWAFVMAMPITTFNSFSGIYEKIFYGDKVIFYVLNALYWIGWINFYVGLFNCLPAIPLDGGRIFQEFLKKVSPKAESLSKVTTVIVFVSIALSVIIPNVRV
ncbi:peptidase M50 [Ferroglobus placidus DSM 10642]|uniref:Peptidase M50 n=1 Tax=Ferroglobus placidus (strain DSM 10642 / AEDII12DO) TaxID=589924 RepID=D3RXM9_FERPA|nr:site-2 protease family protein [Ferroglobus placidus]ADC65242.1 peptidase M50 [Ferroglobus placidus DSM 10642]